jgi:peptide/nickel transport system substrate-binding protein
LGGEIDYLREDAGTDKLALYKENEEAGGYRVQLYPGPTANSLGNGYNIRFNLTYEDEVWRQVVRDIRFRRGVIHSLDVPAIIEAIFFGFGEPEEMVGHEYNPDKANQFLDEMGLDQRDNDGFRLGPDGETFEVPFEIASYNPAFVPTMELIVEYMNAVGLKTTMQVVEPGLHSTRINANEVQATIMWDHRGAWWGWGGPFGNGDIHARAWPLWWSWHTSAGEQGEEPPEELKTWFDLLDASVVVAPSDSVEIVEEYRRMYSEHLWFIEMIMNSKHPIIVSKRLGNIPYDGTANGSNIAGEQFFFRA